MRDFQKHLLKGMATGLGICLSVGAVWTAVSFAAASWGALPTVNGGSGLTSTAWNDVISHVNALAGGMNVTGGVVGIGTNTPNVYANHAKLAVNGGISYWATGNGRHVHGWHSFGTSTVGYRHIKTTLWAGGAPSGNTQFIMGGWHVRGYRYTTAGILDTQVYFHNWDGVYANKNIVENGNWTSAVDVYTSSDGYVVLRIATEAYTGFVIDLHQFFDYPTRDIRISAETQSASATYY